MHIEFVEIANFRKLLSARVDLSLKTTLFVGVSRQSGHRVTRHIAQASPFALLQQNRGCQPCNRMHALVTPLTPP